MKRPRLVPSKVFYLWEKLGLRRIELFSGEDLDKKSGVAHPGKFCGGAPAPS